MQNKSATELARELVGDGGTPNLFFVTCGPYVNTGFAPHEDYGGTVELIEGYTKDDAETEGPFNSYEEALDYYDGIELDADFGIGQVFIEDRSVGTVREKFLKKQVKITYVEEEVDDSRLM